MKQSPFLKAICIFGLVMPMLAQALPHEPKGGDGRSLIDIAIASDVAESLVKNGELSKTIAMLVENFFLLDSDLDFVVVKREAREIHISPLDRGDLEELALVRRIPREAVIGREVGVEKMGGAMANLWEGGVQAALVVSGGNGQFTLIDLNVFMTKRNNHCAVPELFALEHPNWWRDERALCEAEYSEFANLSDLLKTGPR